MDNSTGLYDVIVVGAGASGLAASIAASRRGARVLVLEGDVKPARKLLRTGNGRCNLSNRFIEVAASTPDAPEAFSQYHNAQFVKQVLQGYGCDQVRKLFQQIGLVTYADSEGRIYPTTNRARSVSDVLMNECRQLGIEFVYEAQVVRLLRPQQTWAVHAQDGRVFHAARVVLATGSTRLLDGLDIATVPQTPVLGPLRTQGVSLRPMDGVRMRCRLTVLSGHSQSVAFDETGEVLFRPYGISGVVVFDASRVARKGDVVQLDLMPHFQHHQLIGELKGRAKRAARCGFNAGEMLDGLLVRSVAETILDICGSDALASASDISIAALCDALKCLSLTVTGGPKPDEAQVMRGGIDVGSLDSSSLAVDGHDGLYACGEIVDVDGACGGYNLHWAWASGIRAGAAASRIS